MTPLLSENIKRRAVDQAAVDALRGQHSTLSEIEARVLSARGYVATGLPEVMALGIEGLEVGAARVSAAIDAKARIVVIADYDCDGATSCATMVKGLRALGAAVDFVVPDRLVHGYGISPSVVDLARERFPDTRLLITVDNGILGHAGISYAAQLGIDVVVTDHHLPGNSLPTDACAIINPSRDAGQSRLRQMAGVGVAAWLVRAVRDLRAKAGKPGSDVRLNFLLPFVAVGTIADLVPVGAVNQALVAQGLKMMRADHAPEGLRQLIYHAGINPAFMTTTDIGFGIAPRINAAGRLSSMDAGIELLLTDDARRGMELSLQLSETNEQRKKLQREAIEQAHESMLDEISQDETAPDDGQTVGAIIACNANWHPGVVGLVASKLKELHGLPAFAFTTSGGPVKGSGRSIAGFHLKDALEEIARRDPDVLHHFGGHAMAAGATLTGEAAIPVFERLLNEIARKQITPEMLNRELPSDGEMPKQFSFDVASRLLMHPWGQRFEAPAFDDVVCLGDVREMGREGKHWRARARVKSAGQIANLVFFNQSRPPEGVDLHVYLQPGLNTWKDDTSLQWIAQWLI